MSCHQYTEEQLWDAAETDQLPAELVQHLDVCPACRETLQQCTSAMTGFAALREVQAPDPCAAVYARLAPARRPWRLAPVWAAGLVLLTVCVLLFRHGQRSEPSRPAPSIMQSIPKQVDTPSPVVAKQDEKKTVVISRKPEPPAALPPQQTRRVARRTPHRQPQQIPDVVPKQEPSQPATVVATISELERPCEQTTAIDTRRVEPRIVLPPPARRPYYAMTLPRVRKVEEPRIPGELWSE